jgi:phthalate 3,4-dioxygenase beta subunit
MRAIPAAQVGGELVDIHVHFECIQFLNLEAALLDARRYEEWLGLLEEDIRYLMPVQLTTSKEDDASALGGMAHFDEDHYSLSKRVERLLGEHAWTENPPSRTRRFVTNVRVTAGAVNDELHCLSYLLLFRSRLDVRSAEWLSGERRDLLRRVEGGLRLAERTITVDESVLRVQNLAVFL